VGNVTYWDNASCLWDPITKSSGPSSLTDWLDEQGNYCLRLYETKNRLAGSNSSGAGRAYDLKLIDDQYYQILNNPTGANPVELELGRKFSNAPVIIESRRKFSDFGTLSLYTHSTDCPLSLVVARMKQIAAKERGLPQFGQWKADADAWQRRTMPDLKTPVMDSRGLTYQRIG